jgi:hypothetical protein
MSEITYNVGDIRHMILEKSGEFSPKLGPNVASENKKNNEKSYKESEKRAKDYDGGLKDPKKMKLPEKTDGNRTTLDYNPIVDPTPEYKKRVEAQAKGYTSDLEEKNGNKRGGCEMDDEGRILKQFTDARDKRDKEKADLQKAGLVARELPKNTFDKNHLTEGKKPKAKRLIFKHSKFINESMVYSRIPEEYKVDGQKIYVNDAAGNEFIVECTLSKRSGMVEVNITGHKNEKLMNEQVSRIHELMDYSEKTNTSQSVSEKLNEDAEFRKIMDLTRGK